MMDSLIHIDRSLFTLLNGAVSNAPLDFLWWLFSFIGEGFMLAILGGIGLFLFDKKRFPKNFIVFALVLLLTGAAAQIAKRIVDKPRPMGDHALVGEKLQILSEKKLGPTGIVVREVKPLAPYNEKAVSLRIIGKKLGKRGFPSGHTASAFGFAFCLIYAYRRKRRYLWLVFAAGVSYSRIAVAAHYPLDLLGGAIIGIFVPGFLLTVTEKYHGLRSYYHPPVWSPNPVPTIAIVAGEASADLYGAKLIREIRKQRPDAKVFGIGGDQMVQAGLDRVHDSGALSIVGFTAVVTAIFTIRRIYLDILSRIKKERPQVLICIDLPDFNLMLANFVRSWGVRVVYYISPQFWAWRKGRLYSVGDKVDRMIVAFPFEKELYDKTATKALFFGHPLLETIGTRFDDRKEACAHYGLDPEKEMILVAPGSRKNETIHLAPKVFKAGAILQKELPGYQFAVPVAPRVNLDELKALAAKLDFSPVFVRDAYRDLCKLAKFGLITSGTATLEAALLDCPMLIVYAGNRLNAALARRLVKVDNIGLPNIILGGRYFDELLQEEAEGDLLAKRALEILADPEQYERYLGYCKKVRQTLTGGDTSAKVAQTVLDLTEENSGRS